MTPRRIVVVGGSSGGLDAFRAIAAELPADFPAAICLVLHTAPDSPGMLARIIGRSSRLPAAHAANGMRLEQGHIYIAPPDHHLLVEPGVLRVTRGPKENRFRPAIDPLFRSAARVYGPAAVGVVLSGNLDDGAAGLWTIKRLGGIAIVQDPADADFPSMPASAARHVQIDHSVPRSELASLLLRLTAAPAATARNAEIPELLEVEVKIAKEVNAIEAGLEGMGEPSEFACPECHGVLLRLKEAHPLRFRCHTGHAFTAESLLAAVDGGIDDALWNAVRTLEEAGLLLQSLAAHQASNGSLAGATVPPPGILAAEATETRRHADVVREVVLSRTTLTALAKPDLLS